MNVRMNEPRWADFKSIWLEHRPKAQTLAELQEQVRAGIMYFTNQFISAKRNDQTVVEYYHDLVGQEKLCFRFYKCQLNRG